LPRSGAWAFSCEGIEVVNDFNALTRRANTKATLKA